MNLVLPENLEREFREEISRRLGYKKGNLKIATEEAIRAWIDGKPRKSIKSGSKDENGPEHV